MPVLSILVMLTVVIGAMAWGSFVPLNGVLYDAATRLFETEPERDVAVVEVPRDADPAAVDWTDVARKLAERGAHAIAFTFVPAGEWQLPPVAGRPVIIPAAERIPGLNPASSDQPTPTPPRSGETSVVAIPPSQYGVHRTQMTSVELDGVRLPTIEVAASGAADDGPFYVRFPGGRDGIPQFGFYDVAAGRVPDSLIAGRTILIGREEDGLGLATPLDPSAPAMAPLIYHAFALQTLLSDRVPRPLTLPVAGLLVVGAALLGAALYSRTVPRQAIAVTVVVTGGILAAGLGALFRAATVLPIAELLVSQGLLSLMIWRSRESLQDQTLGRIARQLDPPGAVATQQTRDIGWTCPILNLAGSLVLAQDERGVMREVASSGLRLADLPPAVRNGRDAGFQRAAREASPTPLAEGSGRLWVAPLLRERQIVGYWLMARSIPVPEDGRAMIPTITALTPAIAELARGDGMPAQDGFDKRVDEKLMATVTQLESRVGMLEQVLDQASTGLAVRDLLGRDVLTTSRFRQHLRAAGIGTADTDPVQLVSSLAGIDADRAAAMLRFVLGERLRISTPANGLEELDAVLRLSFQGTDDDGAGAHLLFELADLGEARRAAEVRRTISEQLDFMLRNDLEAVQLAVSLVAHPDLNPANRPRVLGRLSDAVARARGRFAAIEPFLTGELASDPDDISPLDLPIALEEAVEAVRRTGRPVDLDMPEIMPPVIAAPAELGPVLRAILALLGEDMRPDERISVTVREEIDRVRIALAAKGVGLPNERLQAYLAGSREPESAEMRALVRGARQTAAWGGSLDGQSNAGSELRFIVTLRKLA